MKKIHIRDAMTQGWSAFMRRPWYLLGVSITFFVLFAVSLGNAVVTALGAVLYGGFIMMLMDHFRGKEVEFDNLFSIQNRWVSYSFLVLIKSLLILLGLVLFVIPGIYLAIRWSFAELLVVDKGMRPLEALRASSKMTEGNRWKLLIFALFGIFLILIGLLFFLIGAIVAGVVLTFAMIKVYEDLKVNLQQSVVSANSAQETVA